MHVVNSLEISLRVDLDNRRYISTWLHARVVITNSRSLTFINLKIDLFLCVRARSQPWARTVSEGALKQLGKMWAPRGFFYRSSMSGSDVMAFSNFGVAVGLQAAHAWPGRVAALNNFFRTFKSGDEYDVKGITWVMGCNALFPGELLRDNWEPPLDPERAVAGLMSVATPAPKAAASAAVPKGEAEGSGAGASEGG